MCYNFKSTCPPNATCPNNSAAQGWQYYEQISDGTRPPGFRVTGIQSCPTAEGVPAGVSPDGGASGQVAVEKRMEQFCQ